MSEVIENAENSVKDCADLKARYEAGERNFARCDLSGCDLSGANLRDVILDEASLKGTIFRGANLQRARLRKANLDSADLYGAILDWANLEEACLEGAFLDAVSAQSANLRRASLRGASLSAAIMETADLRGADLQHANMLKANLSRARFEQAKLLNASLEEADLTHAKLEGANITGANFRGAKLDGAWVAGVKFDKRTLFWRSSLDQLTGDLVFIRFARDQDYIETFRVRHPLTWRLWSISSDCGRSMVRWLLLSAILTIVFGFAFLLLKNNFFINGQGRFISGQEREVTWFTYFYYSIVTFTTLGFGDVVPRTTLGEVLVSLEVFAGYLMLGGLVSIFANKLARRS